jgi:PAS domain S-box-containing protein
MRSWERRGGLGVGGVSGADLDKLLEHNPAIVYSCTVGRVWTFSYVSPNVAAILGFQPEEILRDPGLWLSRIHPEDRSRLPGRSAVDLLAEGRRIWEYRFRHRDGSYRWLQNEVRLLPDEDPVAEPFSCTGYCVDITERRRAEDALEESEARFAAFMRNSPAMAFMKDDEGRLLYANPAYLRALGLEGREWLGRSDEELLPASVARSTRTSDLEVLAAGVPTAVEEVVPVGTANRVFLTFKFPFRDQAGRVFIAGMGLDATERHLLQERLSHTERLGNVGHVAGGVVHDFNNLLTSILGHVEMAIGRLPPDSPVRRELAVIDRAAERASELARKILDFGQKRTSTVRLVDIGSVVRGLEDVLRQVLGETIELDLDCPRGFVVTMDDPGRINHLLATVAVRAREALGGRGGQMRVRVESDDESGAAISLIVAPLATDVDVDVPVHVDGARKFASLFDDEDGWSGLRKDIARLGGRIESDAHEGSASFRIFLPRTSRPAPVVESPAGFLALPRGSETILLVEDEDLVRDLARRVLGQQGYSVLEAASGIEALSLIERGLGRCDLLLTDVVMPGLGGREIAQHIRRQHPGMKVIFMSGYAEHANFGPRDLGPTDAFVNKPFSPHDLLRAVRSMLDGVRV